MHPATEEASLDYARSLKLVWILDFHHQMGCWRQLCKCTQWNAQPLLTSCSPQAASAIVTASGKKKKGKQKISGFSLMGLSQPVFKGLQRMGYRQPTPIQKQAIPIALAGRDVVAMARTGMFRVNCSVS